MNSNAQSALLATEPPETRAREVLCGRNVPWQPTLLQHQILRELVFHLGLSRAISLRGLRDKTGSDDRSIKDAIRGLVVNFKVRIGSSRNNPPGYYLVVTTEDATAAAQPLIGEIRHLVQRVRVLLDPHQLAELAGQIGLGDLEEEERHL